MWIDGVKKASIANSLELSEVKVNESIQQWRYYVNGTNYGVRVKRRQKCVSREARKEWTTRK